MRVLVLRIAMRFFPQVAVRDFWVVDWSATGPMFGEITRRIEAALQLINEREPRRYLRLQKDVKRFLITNASGAEYIHAVRACMLNPGYLSGASIDQIALTIVHEGTHARLSSRGIKYDFPQRERIERACVREEIAFANKLPDGADLIKAAKAKLDRRWWTEEEEFDRRLRQLEQLGRPRWYRRLYSAIWSPY
jgi:hypothetical protein